MNRQQTFLWRDKHDAGGAPASQFAVPIGWTSTIARVGVLLSACRHGKRSCRHRNEFSRPAWRHPIRDGIWWRRIHGSRSTTTRGLFTIGSRHGIKSGNIGGRPDGIRDNPNDAPPFVAIVIRRSKSSVQTIIVIIIVILVVGIAGGRSGGAQARAHLLSFCIFIFTLRGGAQGLSAGFVRD
jgi:hypothetical protein